MPHNPYVKVQASVFAATSLFAILLNAMLPTAAALEPTLFCTPDRDQADAKLQLQRVGPDMLRATGVVLAPSPGYSVALRASHNHGLIMEFLPPKGADMMMIATLEINQTLTVPPLNLPIAVKVEKPFNWGPNLFVCE